MTIKYFGQLYWPSPSDSAIKKHKLKIKPTPKTSSYLVTPKIEPSQININNLTETENALHTRK